MAISKSVTVGGIAVRIYAIDAGGNRPIHGAYEHHEGWQQCSWLPNGRFSDSHRSDLDLATKIIKDANA